ncbi:hypothetical protein ACFYZ6_09815 [Streptomyces rubiginosohelvolus]|uniref:hypothetical protein n=1 Tax=Streptomyces TaxID=1883 RepID=UPI000BEF344E|nr:hypothetical protein [Streptomyces sp. ms184]
MSFRKRLTGGLVASATLAATVLALAAPAGAQMSTSPSRPAGAATAEAAPAAQICGLRKVGDRGVYHNCKGESRRILVTKYFTANETFCVLPNADWDVGQWRNIYAAYDEAPC